MPIAANRRMMSSGASRVDIYDPALVLYLPLWNTVARGGSIKNGTGTMNVSPQNLAVGANTITVTVAGTLIVSMPEGGTVASGTMTVTGSPVTVSAGIVTTITTTGAIGNITVTSSNIIRTKDKNNISTTITSATWSAKGRAFNGTTDFLNLGDLTSVDFGAGNFALEITLKFTSVAGGPRMVIISKDLLNQRQFALDYDSENDSTDKLGLIYYTSGGSARSLSATNVITNTNYHHLIAQRNGNAFEMYLDTVSLSLTASGTHGTMQHMTSNLNIGRREYVGVEDYFNGTISEVLIYNKALTATEVLQHYHSAKRRIPWLI